MILEGAVNQYGPIITIRLRGPGGEREGDALLDTGAQNTIVDRNIVRSLHAPIVGTRKTMGACGTCDMSRHAVGIRIAGLDWEERELYAAPALETHRFIAAVGWDVLKRGRFSVDGPKRRWRFVID